MKKVLSLNAISLILAVIAITSAQISFLSGGIHLLDSLALLLVPGFLCMLWKILSDFEFETKDYCVAFAILAACILFAIFYKYRFEVGTMDDDYHTAKTIAYSVDNNFQTKFQYLLPQEDERFYIIDFIESIWGIFYRWFRFDHIIVLLQALPIVLLWKELVHFFRRKNITTIPGLLATATVLSLEILWCQQGSTYIDSVAGIFGGLVLLGSYDLLTQKDRRTFYPILGLALVSALCLISKTSLVLVAGLGLGIAFWAAIRYLDHKKILAVFLSILPSLLYLAYHHVRVWQIKGHPLYPWWGTGGVVETIGKNGFSGMLHFYYEADPIYQWIQTHAFDFKPFYVFASWLLDFKPDGYLTADPWVRGNGLLWTYVVIPTLLWAAIVHFKKLIGLKTWTQPTILIFLMIVLNYYFFDGSIAARFMLGLNIFILAWCLALSYRKLEGLNKEILRYLNPALVGVLLILSALSYFPAIQGAQMQPKMLSVLSAQYKVFPQYIRPVDFHKMILLQARKQITP